MIGLLLIVMKRLLLLLLMLPPPPPPLLLLIIIILTVMMMMMMMMIVIITPDDAAWRFAWRRGDPEFFFLHYGSRRSAINEFSLRAATALGVARRSQSKQHGMSYYPELFTGGVVEGGAGLEVCVFPLAREPPNPKA